jgi:putative cell wall-binding protein
MLLFGAVPALAAAADAGIAVSATRTDAQVRGQWSQLKPSYSGAPYAIAPSIEAPYATGTANAAFLNDGLGVINFARFLAGVPSDVTLDATRNLDAQHGAVLLAASTFSHTPPKPIDMSTAFYDRALGATQSSNIGHGLTTSEAFQLSCLADSDTGNISRLGHRRWLLNPQMLNAGIGYAEARHDTYVFDRSRTAQVAYSAIAYPSAGPFPVDGGFFSSVTPWSITLNPARYDWDSTGHVVTLRRVADGRTWTFNASDTNASGEFFNFDTGGYGVSNAFVFRPSPSSVVYKAGDEFDVMLSGGIYVEGTRTPASVGYRTRFISLTASGGLDTSLVVTPIEGANRIGTAVAASQEAFASSTYVVIATGFNWPDALGGSALAGALKAPILLTSQSGLSAEVRTEIIRLKATKAIILGGTPAVSATVASQIVVLTGCSVERIAGANRYDTANLVAARAIAEMRARGGYDGTAFVSTGMDFPDALGASPLAAAKGWPIYLANPARGNNASSLAAVMKSAGVKKAILLGGTNVVGATVESALRASLGSATRLAGANRYDTALKVASYGVANAGLSWDKVAPATGQNFPDALAGGVLQGASGSVLVLTPTASLNEGVAAALKANKGSISEVRFLGSTAALSVTVRSAVVSALQ